MISVATAVLMLIPYSTRACTGRRIAHAISQANSTVKPLRQLQISSRNSDSLVSSLKRELTAEHFLPAVSVDVTKPETLSQAFEGADVVVSLVGILTGSPEAFEKIQWKGVENIARAAKNANAKLIHFSAIGADMQSQVPYAKTKAQGEEAVFQNCPDATIIRPSLVFGPEDSFFNV
jgi:uncharacterized protein YbjT (DUF2867 family)